MYRTVVSLHGIRTRGVWQKDLAPLLARHGLVPYALDYGYFTPLELLLPFRHKAKLEWLHQQYLKVLDEADCKRPSIIAHSFGGLLVARLLEKYEHVRFDKVILCGCIVPTAYPWTERFATGQVNQLVNEHGTLDIWPRIASRVVSGAGDAGYRGFDPIDHGRFAQRKFPKYGHADYFSSGHFREHWLPRLAEWYLADGEQKRVRGLLQVLIATASQHLGVSRSDLRANFFAPSYAGDLVIPHGLHENLPAREQGIALGKGMGCTGKAFEYLRQVVAVRKGNDWGDHEVPVAVAQMLDPRLSWIIATPVKDPDVHGGVLGVLNLDGLVPVQEADLQRTRVLGDLKVVADRLGALLKSLA